MVDEYGTEFVVTARRATTGDILMRRNVAAMDLDFTWKLKLRLSDQFCVSSPFDCDFYKEQSNWTTRKCCVRTCDQGC